MQSVWCPLYVYGTPVIGMRYGLTGKFSVTVTSRLLTGTSSGKHVREIIDIQTDRQAEIDR